MPVIIGRRELMAALGGATVWPLVARAQQPKIPIVGWMESGVLSPPYLIAPFHAGLKETGYVEGQNVIIDYKAAEGRYERLIEISANFVARGVAVIAATGAVVSPLAARAATTTIPIVFRIGADPVKSGLVDNLRRPTGNITGITEFGAELVAKRMEFFHELLPNAKLLGALLNPNNPAHVEFMVRVPEGTPNDFGVPRAYATATDEKEFEPAIAKLAERHVDGLIVTPDTLFSSYPESLVAATTRHAMPTMFSDRESVVAGGLISYYGDTRDSNHQLGLYVGKVLKGEKPSDLPVVQPSKFELAINLRAAKALGITVPESLLARATEVIE
jgi:putative ABC transport system substrate-binding protein